MCCCWRRWGRGWHISRYTRRGRPRFCPSIHPFSTPPQLPSPLLHLLPPPSAHPGMRPGFCLSGRVRPAAVCAASRVLVSARTPLCADRCRCDRCIQLCRLMPVIRQTLHVYCHLKAGENQIFAQLAQLRRVCRLQRFCLAEQQHSIEHPVRHLSQALVAQRDSRLLHVATECHSVAARRRAAEECRYCHCWKGVVNRC